ncbi:alpha/beta hydrolase [Ancylobacter sp. 6x-1]|uniref:Alpha/beta hydrolase n=1 Tax=Ancylobacter crimeensis TaxID=2579147 RepID=A0ABT0DFB1_9HYPH|nr:alpha/beta hydrolase [Ancylobacter crimeensis]MCK0198657.1 alpha/beta hydrolase [Ancylobacter crimeensis]
MGCGWSESELETGEGRLPVRFYRPADSQRSPALVLHLHGGAFTAGSPACGECVARLLAEAGALVASVDYPLAPAHPFPEPLNRSFAALQALHARRSCWAGRAARLFVAGEEAGANLAAALALMARDQGGPPLAGQILISPMLDPALATRSIRAAEAGAVGCRFAEGWHRYLGSAEKAAHPYAAPLGSNRLGRLPPALILTAEDDPMRDESLAYGERLKAGGVPVTTHVVPAPTRWPAALAENPDASPAMPPDWCGPLRSVFRDFLARPSERAVPERLSDSTRP